MTQQSFAPGSAGGVPPWEQAPLQGYVDTFSAEQAPLQGYVDTFSGRQR